MSITVQNPICNTERRAAGMDYPRTCEVCGHGQCKFHGTADDRFGQKWFDSVGGGSSLDTGPGLKPNPPAFPDGIHLAPGWWKSRNGMIFNIGRTKDGKFINVNDGGMVQPTGALFGWNADGTNNFTPISDGEADQDFALVERIGNIANAPLPIHGKFVVAVVRDPEHPMGWSAKTFKDGVPAEIREHHPGVIAMKVVEFVEGEWE